MALLLIDENFDSSQLSDSLKKLYKIYLQNLEKRTSFERLALLRHKNIELYKEKCLQLSKGVKYINFVKTKVIFEVRPIVEGKRKYLGSFTNFDDACEALAYYLKQQI